MMQNEEKYEKILKALNSRRIIPRPFVAQKLSSGDDFLSHNVLPLDEYHNGLKTEALSVSASEEEGLHFLSECGERKPELPSGRKNQSLTLIELLKSRRLGEERNSAVSPHKTHNQTARKRFVQKCVLPLNEDSPLIYQPQKMDLTMHSGKDTCESFNTVELCFVRWNIHVECLLSIFLFKLLHGRAHWLCCSSLEDAQQY